VRVASIPSESDDVQSQTLSHLQDLDQYLSNQLNECAECRKRIGIMASQRSLNLQLWRHLFTMQKRQMLAHSNPFTHWVALNSSMRYHIVVNCRTRPMSHKSALPKQISFQNCYTIRPMLRIFWIEVPGHINYRSQVDRFFFFPIST
jgi:uncharacterized NAD(P)/FAD-binding protein YdhS